MRLGQVRALWRGAGEAGADPLGSRPCQPQTPEAPANPGRSFGKGSCASLPAAEAVNTG